MCRFDAIRRNQVIKDLGPTNPFRPVATVCQTVFELTIVEQFAFFKVDRNHLSRAEAAFFNAAFFVDMHHARFGTGNQKTIARYRVAQRTQTITVRAAHQPFAAIGSQGCRAVPRLHHGVAIGIEVFIAVWCGGLFRPGFRYHHGFHHRQVTARTHHQFKHSIQSRGVR